MLAKVCLKLACDQYYIDSERNPTGGIVGRTPNNERRYVNMAEMCIRDRKLIVQTGNGILYFRNIIFLKKYREVCQV